MAIDLTKYNLYEDNVLDVLAVHQIKKAVYGASLQLTSLPTPATWTTTWAWSTTVLIDSGANFTTAWVATWDAVFNITTWWVAIVKTKDSATQLTTTVIVGGTDANWDTWDSYSVIAWPWQMIELVADNWGNRRWTYKRNSWNTAWELQASAAVSPLAMQIFI